MKNRLFSQKKIKDLEIGTLKHLIDSYKNQISTKEGRIGKPWAKNYLHNLIKFVEYFDKLSLGLNYNLSNYINAANKYGGGSIDIQRKLSNNFNKLDNLDTAFYDLSHYKDNFWMRKMYASEYGVDDQLGKKITSFADYLYNEFKEIKESYKNMLER